MTNPTSALAAPKVRFEAQWITKQHRDSSGEWNPDRDEYSVSHHITRKLAEQAAVVQSKAAAQCEWIIVAEQHFIHREWIDIRRWSGDWDGLHDQAVEVLAYDE